MLGFIRGIAQAEPSATGRARAERGRAASPCTAVEPRITATQWLVQSCAPPAGTGAAPGYPRIDLCELRHTDATPLNATSVIQGACIRMGIRLSDPPSDSSSDSSGDSCTRRIQTGSQIRCQPSLGTLRTRNLCGHERPIDDSVQLYRSMYRHARREGQYSCLAPQSSGACRPRKGPRLWVA